MPFGSTTPGSGGGGGGTVWSLEGPLSGLPGTPGPAGQRYNPADGAVEFVSDGALWLPQGPRFPLTLPVDSQFAWVNQGSASISTLGGIVYLSDIAHGDTDAVAMRVKGISGNWDVKAFVMPSFNPSNGTYDAHSGLLLRDSASGKFVSFRLMNISNDLYITITKWNGASAPLAEYVGLLKANFLALASLTGLRMQLVGGTRLFSISLDGFNWLPPIYTGVNTDFMVPDQAGFFVNARNGACGLSVYSWQS